MSLSSAIWSIFSSIYVYSIENKTICFICCARIRILYFIYCGHVRPVNTLTKIDKHTAKLCLQNWHDRWRVWGRSDHIAGWEDLVNQASEVADWLLGTVKTSTDRHQPTPTPTFFQFQIAEPGLSVYVMTHHSISTSRLVNWY